MNSWDMNAEARARQISRGIDLSYTHVLLPAVFDLLPKPDGRNWKFLIDAGCGPGFLTIEASRRGWDAVGIDSSIKMVEIAKGLTREDARVRFIHAGFAQMPRLFASEPADAVVANMSLTGVADLRSAVSRVRDSIRLGGIFVIADVHPWFWRIYKNHSDFPYWQSREVEEPFTITLDPTPLPSDTRVVYRPLSAVVSAITQERFLICDILEPKPAKEVEAKYPEVWAYPRFIAIAARAA